MDDSSTLSDRIVLLGLADLAADGTTPAHTGEVVRACKETTAHVEADTLGKLGESETNRALNRLSEAGHVESSTDESSLVGKGRPQYALAEDPGAVVERLSDDEQVGPLAAVVADRL